VPLAERLHVRLRGLEPCSGSSGPERPHTPLAQGVDEAKRERLLRPDDDQIRRLGHRELDEPGHVVRLHVYVAGDELRSRVPGGHDHMMPRGGDDGRERVLARSRPHDHDPFHAAHRPRATPRNTTVRHALDSSSIGLVADDPRPPVAIRITRPYASEDEYLEQELDLLSRTGITLVGAQPRPQGVVLRFELVLAAGHVLLRGEGRVVGFKPSAHRGVGGLTLRFTRIDARSKALLDKAAALREQRRPSNRPVRSQPPPNAELAPSSQLDKLSTPAPLSVASESASQPAPRDRAAEEAPSEAKPVRRGMVGLVAPPGDRDALLDRLRARARALDPTAVRGILEQRRRRA
jgi:hypothetical protein